MCKIINCQCNEDVILANEIEHGGGATRAGVVADVPPGGGAKCATHEAGTLLHTIGCHRYVDIT